MKLRIVLALLALFLGLAGGPAWAYWGGVDSLADRISGWKRALKAHGLQADESVIFKTEMSIESGRAAMQALIRKEPRPTAVFADNLGHVRHLAVSSDNVVYANTWSGRYYHGDTPPAGGFLLALKDTTGTGKADVIQRFGPDKSAGAAGGILCVEHSFRRHSAVCADADAFFVLQHTLCGGAAASACALRRWAGTVRKMVGTGGVRCGAGSAVDPGADYVAGVRRQFTSPAGVDSGGGEVTARLAA